MILRTPRLRWALITLALSPVGCSEAPTPPVVAVQNPRADSPQAALRLLEWCYNNRAIAQYRELFTDDYRFQFGALDPYGNAYRENPWTREDELLSASNLFYGSAERPAAVEIELTLDPSFIVQPDPRPGKDPRWHKFVRSQLTLRIIEADNTQRIVHGNSAFFLVRGDSALIPLEMVDRGIRADSTLWFVQRWEDESPISPGDRAMPVKSSTLGSIKALYR